MNSLKTFAAAATIALAAPFALTAQAQSAMPHGKMDGMNMPGMAMPGMKMDATADMPMTDGEVRKIDKDNRKITLKHGDIKNLDMPGMTMVFTVTDPALLDKVQVGNKVRFVAAKADGALVVTAIEAVK
ncbi:MAG: copper-binding protein [Burkholderiales bacterium]|nr:copper-binding protein [Burkholderiales bacterium]